jgi:hypothetical protein
LELESRARARSVGTVDINRSDDATFRLSVRQKRRDEMRQVYWSFAEKHAARSNQQLKMARNVMNAKEKVKPAPCIAAAGSHGSMYLVPAAIAVVKSSDTSSKKSEREHACQRYQIALFLQQRPDLHAGSPFDVSMESVKAGSRQPGPKAGGSVGEPSQQVGARIIVAAAEQIRPFARYSPL